jgi:NTP pyrophosphatase (non-canonical NTP hydrolase)
MWRYRMNVQIIRELRDLVWRKDIPSQTTPEYKEHHRDIQEILAFIDNKILIPNIWAVDLEEYQRDVLRTTSKTSTKDMLTNGVMGLTGESGEVADMVKKYMFQGHPLSEDDLIEELGDVCYYIALIAEAVGSNINEVIRKNTIKRQDRYPLGFDAERSKNREA